MLDAVRINTNRGQTGFSKGKYQTARSGLILVDRKATCPDNIMIIMAHLPDSVVEAIFYIFRSTQLFDSRIKVLYNDVKT